MFSQPLEDDKTFTCRLSKWPEVHMTAHEGTYQLMSAKLIKDEKL